VHAMVLAIVRSWNVVESLVTSSCTGVCHAIHRALIRFDSSPGEKNSIGRPGGSLMRAVTAAHPVPAAASVVYHTVLTIANVAGGSQV
jgi:hypothetical protein